MSEILTLVVERLLDSGTQTTAKHEISGEASFIWEELGILLVDPLVTTLTMSKAPTRASTTAQTYR